jgi:hypothetical protein
MLSKALRDPPASGYFRTSFAAPIALWSGFLDLIFFRVIRAGLFKELGGIDFQHLCKLSDDL